MRLPPPGSLWPTASTLQSPPGSEPITLGEAKAHLKIDGSDEDAYIATLITVARLHVEEAYGWALITQTWDVYYPGFPAGLREMVITQPPLQSVTEVEYTLDDGTTAVLSASVYNVDAASSPGRIVPKRDQEWPSDSLDTGNPVRVRCVVGFGEATDVPENIVHATKIALATLYDHRESIVVGTIMADVTLSLRALLEPRRGPVMA